MAKCDTIFAVKNQDGTMMTLGLQRGYFVQLPGGITGASTMDTEARLKMLKKHVRADDFTDDDDYLSGLLDVADEYICRVTGRNMEELVEIGKGEMPAPLWQAELLLCGHFYANREAVGSGHAVEIPYTLSALVKPYVKLVRK